MLQQILKDMYIDPDVLDALNEEQKKTLFLKMRQEQVRRWKEREEKLEREGGAAESKGTKARNANSKSVSWLLGRDGDVSVLVIGEVDELTSKFISHQTTLKSQNTTQDVNSECQSDPQKTQPEVSMNLKQEKREETSTLRPLPLQEKASSPTELKCLSQTPVCSRPPTRGSSVNARTASAIPTPGSVNTRSGLGNLGLAASIASSGTVQLDSASASTAKGSLCSKEPQKAQDSRAGKDIAALERFRRADSAEAGKSLTAPTCTGRGRVTDLIKNFSVDTPAHSSSRGLKPPLPSKPVHLRLTTTPTVR